MNVTSFPTDTGNDDAIFIALDRRSLSQYHKLFVRPFGFPPEPEDSQQRIFLIVGEPESGKEIAAINFALALADKEQQVNQSGSPPGDSVALPIKMYQRRGKSQFLDLNTVLTNPPEAGVFIIPDIPEANLPEAALSPDTVGLYTTQLHKHRHKAYFILTMNAESWSNLANRSKIGLSPYSTDGLNLEAIVVSHANFYFGTDRFNEDDQNAPELIKILRLPETRQKICSQLKTPKKIGILFQNLSNVPLQDGEEAAVLQRLIRNILIRETSELRRWFRDLPMNVKLFAMTMAILLDNNYELERFAAEELYFAFVQKVRQKPGLDSEAVFIDPRRMGFNDVVTSANMIVEGQTLSFNSDEVQKSIREYEIENYQGLLWILAEMLVDQIAPPPQQTVQNPAIYNYIGNPDAPTLLFGNAQEVLANLVGTIGISRSSRLRDLLMRLSQMGEHKELAGQILFPLSRNHQYHGFYLDLLETWLYPKDTSGKITEAYHPEVITTAIYTLANTYAAAAATEPTRQKLHEIIIHLGEICGSLETYLADYETARQQQLNEQIATIRAEKGEKALTDGEIKALQAAVQVEVAQLSLATTEIIIIFLLAMLQEIAEQYPEEVVQVINHWLQSGLNQVENDDFELDDDADIERMLRIEDASLLNNEQTRAVRRRQSRKKRIVLHNMQWHIGMLSAVMFFEAEILGQPEEPEAEVSETEAKPDTAIVSPDDNPEAAPPQTAAALHAEPAGAAPPATRETDNESAAAAAETNQAEMGVTSSSTGEVAHGDGAIPSGTQTAAETLVSEELSSKQPTKQTTGFKVRQKNDNRITIVQKKFPFLELLPNLLASADITFSPTSFLENLTRGDKVRQSFRLKKLDYQFDVPFEFLQRDPLRAAFHMMHKWYGVMVDNPKAPDEKGQKAWIETVFPALLKLFNHASQGQRPRLRQILFTEGWVESPHLEIRNIAHALLARSFILDGRILDLPANRYGVVLLDWSIRDYPWDRYYQGAYRLIQQLSAITPIRIYALGSTRMVKEIAGRQSDVQILARELRPKRTSPRLLLPLFESVFNDPVNTHFILALTPVTQVAFDAANPSTRPDILDLLDIVELVTETTEAIDPQLQKILLSNLYREEEKEEARRKIALAAQQANDWVWKQKLFLLTPDKETVIQQLNALLEPNLAPGLLPVEAVEKNFSLVEVQDLSFHDDVETIVAALSLKLGKNLHSLPNTRWDQDLQNIWAGAEDVFGVEQPFDFANPAGVEKQLEQWIASLEDVTRARHPRDITMTIVWTVLAFSKHSLPLAVSLINQWLNSGKTPAEIMGLACAKTLYNFYSLVPDLYTQSTHYQVLLDLLPAVTSLERGCNTSEFSQFINFIMVVARDAGWSNILLAGGENPLAGAVKKIKGQRNLTDLRHQVNRQQLVVRLAGLYLSSGMNWGDFRTWMGKIADWYNKTPAVQRPQQLSKLENQLLTPALPRNFVQRSVALLNEIALILGGAYTTTLGVALLMAFATAPVQELSLYAEAELREIEVRVRNLANFIMLHSLRTLDIKMPLLRDDQRYGVILLRGTGPESAKDLRSHVIGFIKDIRLRLREQQQNNIVLTLHHLGRSELIYNNDTTPPTQITLRLPEKTTEPALLMTPILEAYRPEDTAFVLIVSDIQPLDLGDWLDEPEWLEKMYLFGRGRSAWIDAFYGLGDDQRKRRIKADVKEVTDMILEVINH